MLMRRAPCRGLGDADHRSFNSSRIATSRLRPSSRAPPTLLLGHLSIRGERLLPSHGMSVDWYSTATSIAEWIAILATCSLSAQTLVLSKEHRPAPVQ